MQWLERFNEAIDYMESNLTERIDMERAAQLAACSQYHFQRMFSYIAGIPLSEYLRRRKMTAAAFELISADTKIIELALKYGYESPTAFNRAFQSVHGISPSAARAEGIKLTAFPRIIFTLSVKGETAMNYKIEKKEAFRIVGAKATFNMDIEESMAKVPVFWQEVIQKGKIPDIMACMDPKGPAGLLGVSICGRGELFDYYVAVKSDFPETDGLESYLIPETTWAVFECIGPMPEAMQTLQKRIVTEWLPTSGWEYADAPDIEVYFEGDQKALNYRSEVWMPIMKNNK